MLFMRPALTDIPMPFSARRMGRPPLGLKLISVRLPPSVVERIDALQGQHRRAQFIREAVEEKLQRDEAEPRKG